MTVAQEFLQPFIDSNIYWMHKLLIVGIIGVVVTLIFNIISRTSSRKGYDGLELFFNISSFAIGVITFVFFMVAIVMKCETVDMKKFPNASYNKIKRSVMIEAKETD